MSDSTLIAHVDTTKTDYAGLALIPCPDATDTHKPIPHKQVVDALVETLGFRHIAVHKMEFALSEDGNKMFGLMELDQTFTGARFAIGLRNSHDKTMRLALTIGYRVFVCDNMAFHGDFTPVLAKHTKNFNLTNALEMGIGQMQRGFDPRVKAVEAWREIQLTDEAAKLFIYRAFVEDGLEAPKHLARDVHQLYFDPQHEEFRPRTLWSLTNAFTGAFKQLDPIPQYKATGKLASFLEGFN